MSLTIDDLVVSTAAAPIRAAHARRAGLVKICRGIYLPESLLAAEAPPWEKRRLVTQARALACTHAKAPNDPPIFTGETALSLHGIGSWWNTPDIAYRRTQNYSNKTPRKFPEVIFAGSKVMAVAERKLRGQHQGATLETPQGATTASLSKVAADLGRFAHPLSAVVGISGILRKLSAFDKFRPHASRAREKQAKAAMLEELAATEKPQAHAAIAAADAGIETPGEGFLLWLLHCLLRDDHQITTQHLVEIGDQRFFLDAAIVSAKVGFEFDGTGKLLTDNHQAASFLRRQNLLLSQGWRIVRVSIDQITNAESLVNTVMEDLRRCGLRAGTPRGVLWKPVSDSLLSPGRRF